MSGTQRISDAAFKTFENTLGEVSTHLSTNLRNLINAVATVEAAWTGQAGMKFRETQTALNEDHEALRQLIVHIHEAVELTHRSSGANDGEIAAELGKIDVNGAKAGGGLGSGADGLAHSKVDGY
ncbi:WXG100 family type VII secretion target [Streptomyces cucumeris]|uniref:WXG100 family type VII secretion target n=1 Tax=Streptomyces cucumeris TaxID=2962890 RepID=UPI003D71DA64